MSANAHLNPRTVMLGGATLATSSILADNTPGARARDFSLNPQALRLSPNWARALPPGPDTSVKVTQAYAAMVARNPYFGA
jgi:hypothetical protein